MIRVASQPAGREFLEIHVTHLALADSSSMTLQPQYSPMPSRPLRVAVIGGGVSGLGAAYTLSRNGDFEVTIYESNATLGGHAQTVEVNAGSLVPVDVGFLVFNENTYPNLCGLFEELNVPHEPSDMSFAVSLAGRSFEWSSDGLKGLLGQPSNAFSSSFHSMISDLLRFNKEAPEFLARVQAEGPGGPLSKMTMRGFLTAGAYSDTFIASYLVPQMAAVWSAAADQVLEFPAITLVQFMINHSLLQAVDRPQWRTVSRRSREYVRRIVAAMPPALTTIKLNARVTSVNRVGSRVIVRDASGAENEFDRVIFGAHPDEVLSMLGDNASPEERDALSGFHYACSKAYLHHDVDFMPERRHIWASWNYMGKEGNRSATRKVGEPPEPCCVSYWLNRLQNLPEGMRDLFVTLNPATAPAEHKIIKTFSYSHPQYTLKTIDAQNALGKLQGTQNTWFAGAYLGYGFHEDGLTSGLRAGIGAGGERPVWWKESMYSVPDVLLTPAEVRTAVLNENPATSHNATAPAPSSREIALAKASGGPYWRDNLGNGGVVGKATREIVSLVKNMNTIQASALSVRAALRRSANSIPDTTCILNLVPRPKGIKAAVEASAALHAEDIIGSTAESDILGFLSQSPDDVLYAYASHHTGSAVNTTGLSSGFSSVSTTPRSDVHTSSVTASGQFLRATPKGGVDVSEELALATGVSITTASILQGRRAYKSVIVGDSIVKALLSVGTEHKISAGVTGAYPSLFRSSPLQMSIGELMDQKRGGYTGQPPPLQDPTAYGGSSLYWMWSASQSMALRAAASPVMNYLRSSIVDGCILLRTPDGIEQIFGNPAAEFPLRARIRVHSWMMFLRIAGESDLGLARSFIAGEWTTDDLTSLFNIFIANRDRATLSTYGLWTAWIGLTINFLSFAVNMDNSVANSRSNIHAHYDMSNDLFTSFLDARTMMYSCGFFDTRRRVLQDVDAARTGTSQNDERATLAQAELAILSSVQVPAAPGSETPRQQNMVLRGIGRNVEKAVKLPYSLPAMQKPSVPSQQRIEVVYGGSLEEAQLRKLDHLIARAQVQKMDRVLDLGFGWGGLSIRLAETVGCRVHGITLSKEQHDLALERVRARGLQHLITFEIVDYRVFAAAHPGKS